MDGKDQSHSSWWSQYWPIAVGTASLLLVVAASAGINVIGALPFLVLPGACILMHLFMHRGHQHGDDDHHRPGRR